MKIKGAILAGGYGTRLKPMTNITNKHLLHVYDEPMIFYPLRALAYCGARNIVLVTGAEHAGHFSSLLGDGKDFNISLAYKVQMEAGGIAQALKLCRDYLEDADKIIIVLGDNIFGRKSLKKIKSAVDKFKQQKEGATVILKKVCDPSRFGVATISEDGKRVEKVIEKPRIPETDMAVTGFYMYDKRIWDIVDKLTPSKRGELEITDVNNAYAKKKQLGFELLQKEDEWWIDAGTCDSLFYASWLARSEKTGEDIILVLEKYLQFIKEHREMVV